MLDFLAGSSSCTLETSTTGSARSVTTVGVVVVFALRRDHPHALADLTAVPTFDRLRLRGSSFHFLPTLLYSNPWKSDSPRTCNPAVPAGHLPRYYWKQKHDHWTSDVDDVAVVVDVVVDIVGLAFGAAAAVVVAVVERQVRVRALSVTTPS